MKIEADHGMFAKVTVPFDVHPELYVRLGFGAKVETGDTFTVQLCSGVVLTNPTAN